MLNALFLLYFEKFHKIRLGKKKKRRWDIQILISLDDMKWDTLLTYNILYKIVCLKAIQSLGQIFRLRHLGHLIKYVIRKQ